MNNLHPSLKFAEVTLPTGKFKVCLGSQLRKCITEANGREVLTSSFYYDIVNNEPYLADERYVIRDFAIKYPEQHAEVIQELEKQGVKVNSKRNNTFITRQGVINILHVYEIHPPTLLKGGPKMPVIQRNLFGNKTPQGFDDPGIQRKANLLFPPKPIEEISRVKRTGGRRTRLHKPGISIGDASTPSLINLSKPMMPMVCEIPYVASRLESNATFVLADVRVDTIDGEKLLGFKFHERGDFEFKLKRSSSNELGINNITVDQKSPKGTYNMLHQIMKKNGLLNTSLLEPQVATDTILFKLAEQSEGRQD